MKTRLKPIYKTPKEIKLLMKEREKFEKYIKKLMDKGWLQEWYYNGAYFVHFKGVQDLVKENKKK